MRERTELEDSLGAINRLETDLKDAEDLAVRLFKDGKLFQPRLYVNSWGNAHSLKDTWYDILPTESSSEAAKNAWATYVMMSKLSQ